MTLDDVEIGDTILIPVRIVNYPGEKHFRKYQKLIRAELGNQVLYLSEEELKNAERCATETEKS